MKLLNSFKINDRDVDLVLLDLKVARELKYYFRIFEKCFGKRSNITPKTFTWYNLEHPCYDNLTFAFVDVKKSKLIACYGLLPGDANVNKKIVKYVLCSNVMSHPEYAGQGLFTRIGAEALAYARSRGFTFALGVPNQQAVRGHLKVGWEVVNEIRFYEVDLRTLTIEKPTDEVERDHIQSLNDYDYFSMFSDKYAIYFSRTSKWMKWRLSKPYSDYVSLTVSNDGNTGFLILKKYYDLKYGLKKIHIVDFGYEKPETFLSLIRYGLQLAQKEGFAVMNTWQYDFNRDEVACLQNLGFVETDTTSPIIIHKMSNVLEIPEKSWHLTLFDNDVY